MRLVHKLVPSIATFMLGIIATGMKRKYKHCEVLEVMIETVY